MLRVDAAVSDDAVTSFVFRIEVSPEQVDALAPRLREALSANGNDGELTRRAATIAAREERLERRERDLAAYVDQLQDTMSAGAPLPGPPGVSQLRRSA